jgi:hypothetical protein
MALEETGAQSKSPSITAEIISVIYAKRMIIASDALSSVELCVSSFHDVRSVKIQHRAPAHLFSGNMEQVAILIIIDA